MRKDLDHSGDDFDTAVASPPRKSLTLGLAVVAAILVVALSVAISVAITQSTADKTEYVKPEDLANLADQLAKLDARLTEREKHLDLLIKAIPAINDRIENSTGVTMQKLMLEQEKSIQSFLKNLKSGMYDLAHMIPGSRTWLEQYNVEMNKALQLSLQRSRELTRLETGAVLIEPGKR